MMNRMFGARVAALAADPQGYVPSDHLFEYPSLRCARDLDGGGAYSASAGKYFHDNWQVGNDLLRTAMGTGVFHEIFG